MANERDFSFKCLKITLIVIHSLAIIFLILLFIGCFVVLGASDKKILSPEEKDAKRKFTQ